MEAKGVLDSLLQKNLSDTAGKSHVDADSDQSYEQLESQLEDPQTVYHCGILLHNVIKQMEDTLPWSPSPEDITLDNINVPDLLFNFIAYVVTGTSKPVSEGRLPVNSDVERVILSLVQDVINVVRKGRIKTVKNIGLAVALRNITGNAEVLTLLNKFGHTLSYSKIQEFEKALLHKYHGEHQNSLILPSTVRKNGFCTFVWDNNYLSEETLSGEGTTHVTNGIIIQREVDIF